MSRPVEQALNNLIPRHPGALPPELIELASSLLAQSRSKISSLRADEEIGRTYACANIACERLKTTLNLPAIEPRPPCPPKVYAKLYNHFDRLLASSTRKRAKSSSAAAAATPSKPLPEKRTPGKDASLQGFRARRTPRRGPRYGGSKASEKLPLWVGPAVRALCRELDAGKAVPHVFAGVESVLFLPCQGAGEGDVALGEGGGEREGMEGKMPALVAAVWFFAVTRLCGKETNGKEYVRQRKKVLDILMDLREDEAVSAKIGDGEEGWEGWEKITKKDVDDWLLEISVRGWLRMDWFTNMVEGSGAGGKAEDDEAEEEEEESDDIRIASKRMRMAGRGTMMQDKFDYLSEAKREDFAQWKEKMLAKIDELIAEGIMNEDMDTAEG